MDAKMIEKGKEEFLRLAKEYGHLNAVEMFHVKKDSKHGRKSVSVYKKDEEMSMRYDEFGYRVITFKEIEEELEEGWRRIPKGIRLERGDEIEKIAFRGHLIERESWKKDGVEHMEEEWREVTGLENANVIHFILEIEKKEIMEVLNILEVDFKGEELKMKLDTETHFKYGSAITMVGYELDGEYHIDETYYGFETDFVKNVNRVKKMNEERFKKEKN